MTFEWFIARRYLQGGRGAARDRFISIVTLIAVAAVGAGVTLLVLALSLNGGFRRSFEEKLLGATAHITLTRKSAAGITEYRDLAGRLGKLEGVKSATPALYETVLISSGSRAKGIVLKGLPPDDAQAERFKFGEIVEGTSDMTQEEGDPPPLLIGMELAISLGVAPGDPVLITSPQGRLTPFGLMPRYTNFQVRGVYEAGSWDFDSGWGFTVLPVTQEMFRLGDTVSVLEFQVEDVYAADRIAAEMEELAGDEFLARPWMELQESLFRAMKLEKLMTALVISMTVLVSGLNILILLVMQVIQKRRDIAVLLSLGVLSGQVRRIFVLHGLAIGALGTVAGLVVGYVVAVLGDVYQIFPLDPKIYGISFVPFRADIIDGVVIAAIAMGVSYVATLYPSRRATRVVPMEVLRYE